MAKEILIKVGIKTYGKPRLRKEGGFVVVENLLIGDGFHWQQAISAKLPGEVVLLNHISSPSMALQCASREDADSSISLINTLPLETYLECVVGSEMNPKAPLEFMKAHAVISRSWALGKILDLHHKGDEGKVNTPESLIGWDDTAGHKGFHVCSDDHCQRYQGLQPISSEAIKAIRETAGEVLADSQGNLIDTRFSKCCGGTTEIFSTCWQDENPEGLKSFSDPWCDLSAMTPSDRKNLLSSILKDYDLSTEEYGYRWQKEISKKSIRENLKEKFGRDIGEVLSLSPLHRGPSGRIDFLRLNGCKGTLNIGKELWIRRLLSPTHLYSSAFDIEDKGDTLTFSGRGWGHGVGLCQIGAANMAFNGKDYREILRFYYPGSILQSFR